MTTEYRLCWPEKDSLWEREGMLLLVAVAPGATGDALPCRVVGRLDPGSPFAPRERAEAPAERAAALLAAIGVPANLRGCGYMRSALTLASEDPRVLRSLNRRLYPAIAQEHRASAPAVERAIRHAIAVTWARGGGERCRTIMGRACSCVGDHPSNGELLTLLAEWLARGH